MLLSVIGVIASLVVLTVSGDQFVVGLARLASHFGLRATAVGTIVGGLGTSVPQLLVSEVATKRGEPAIAMGSLVGSLIAAVSLALACAALVAPIEVDSKAVRREVPICVAAILVFGICAFGGISRSEALVLLALGVAAMVYLVRSAMPEGSDELAREVEDFFQAKRHRRAWTESLRALIGIAVMIGGAEFLVASASGVEQRVGLSQAFIGLSVVALGTSAPLIAASIQAARRGDHDLVIGSVLGQGIFGHALKASATDIGRRSEADSAVRVGAVACAPVHIGERNQHATQRDRSDFQGPD